MCQTDKLIGSGERDLAALERYFPDGFPEQMQPGNCGVEGPRLTTVETEWYPSQWSAACEPPLEDAVTTETNSQFTFRFSYLPSFDSSIFMRLESDDNGHILIVKQMTGNGGGDPGIISRSKEIELANDEVAAIQESIVGILEARDESIAKLRREGPKYPCSYPFDGTQWILETVQNGEYDLVQDNTPRQGLLFDLGHMLLTKTGWEDVSEF
ncbi:MAG: hypothetical protein G9473_10550 [Erythrobacter sp.]|nr:MAG: hypothetical protein G9473_10550 [Erythrobacter sp.]